MADDLDAVDELVKEIEETIEDLPERAQAAGAEFFESVTAKAHSIRDTVAGTGRATEKQLQALNNFLAGVRKWKRGGT